MPIYEYKCKSCGHQLEAFQKITETPLTECPDCHQSSLTKLISSTSFQLKGTGWYATDFRDKGKPKKEVTGKGESEGGADTSNTGGDKTKDTQTSESKSSDSKPKDKATE